MPGEEDTHRVLDGLEALRAGQPQEAIGFLEAACSNGERGCDAYMYLGIAYAMTGAYEQAISNLERALVLSPNNTTCLYNLGVVYQKKGYRDAAVGCYEGTLKLDAHHQGARRALEQLGALKSRATIRRAQERHT
jgi:Flp pilus assembly protein TadD